LTEAVTVDGVLLSGQERQEAIGQLAGFNLAAKLLREFNLFYRTLSDKYKEEKYTLAFSP